jgi:thiosulfate dehydrogenase
MKNYWLLIVFASFLFQACSPEKKESTSNVAKPDSIWIKPSLYLDTELSGEQRKLVIYGEELIAHTSKYLGPNGSVAHLTNGMNCQNCHLDAGTRPLGNNYSAVFSTYPKFRERSGRIESIYKRVSDCMERSLNGTAIDSNSYEFKAIYAYMQWLGKDVKKDVKPYQSGIKRLKFLDRAADPSKGKLVYDAQCKSCHGENGQGVKDANGMAYLYPPVWGEHSYNDGAGLYRLSNFAGYVKYNMPFGKSSVNAQVLSDEEAWDVAAYVNSQPRPSKDQTSDWPNKSKKPVDFPYPPYGDEFSTLQHKYGPFKPIADFYKKK